MKGTGFVRKIDELGRIVIPKEFRRTYQWEEGCSVEMFMDEEGVYLRKYQVGCVFCGEVETIVALNKKPICGTCYNNIKHSSWK